MKMRRLPKAMILGFGLWATSLLGSGCATAQPHAATLPSRVVQGAIAGSAAGAAIGAGLDHHDRGRGAVIGGIGGLILGAIFADEFDRHDWAHSHDAEPSEDLEWCEEHHQYETVEPDSPEDEAGFEDEAEEEVIAAGVVVSPPDVLFDPGSSTISKGAQSRLAQLADSIEERRDLELVLRGHADVSKLEQDAFAISEERADQVRSFLADEGVAWRRIRIVGLGVARPVASNDSEAGRQRNRRVEIILRDRPPS